MLVTCFLRRTVADHEVDSDIEHVISGVSAAAAAVRKRAGTDHVSGRSVWTTRFYEHLLVASSTLMLYEHVVWSNPNTYVTNTDDV